MNDNQELSSLAATNLLLDHLKSLPAPAIDLEFRSLCTREDDVEGLELLHTLLTWFTTVIVHGTDYELIQAYIARALSIYAEIILKSSQKFSKVLQLLLSRHQATHETFRNLMQSNLCLLKLLSGLPST